jgi:gamma-glutamylcyclotransferase (GGCT)/AIG2-like uncharacterized protein YtfP
VNLKTSDARAAPQGGLGERVRPAREAGGILAATGPRYFAYGSNLSRRQMNARCPSAVACGRGVLDAHRVEFVQPHESWGGGVAGIVADPRSQVPGVIYTLSEADLARLDGFEPVRNARYRRTAVTVRDENHESVRCWTYVGRVFPEAPYRPSPAYLETLLEGAREHQLPAAHLGWLESLRD